MSCYLLFAETAHDVVNTGPVRGKPEKRTRCREY